MPGYGQFCPVAKAMEILDERWTLLIIRELLLGSTRFNELRRGLPRMSPALLVKRLRSLERAGIVTQSSSGRHTAYLLTEGGRELIEVVNALGLWGLRWIPELGDTDYDPHLLMWDMRRTLPVQAWPRARTVVAVRFDDTGPRESRWWVVVHEGEVDVCQTDPGYDVTAEIVTSLRFLTRIWRGEDDWEQAVRAGRVRIDAPSEIRRLIPGWFGQSLLAAAARTSDRAPQSAS